MEADIFKKRNYLLPEIKLQRGTSSQLMRTKSQNDPRPVSKQRSHIEHKNVIIYLAFCLQNVTDDTALVKTLKSAEAYIYRDL